jgi:hypothetical protein
VLFAPTGGGIALVATVLTWSDAAVAVTVPTGATGNYAVSVQTGNGLTSGGILFTVTPPTTFNASAVTWASTGNALPGAVSGAGVTFADISGTGFVYVVGGAGAGGAPVATVSYAAIGTDGSIGAWTAATPLPTALEFPAVVAATQRNSFAVSAGFLYVLGGATSASGTPVSTVYRAPLNANGSIGSWTTITPLPAPLRSAGAVVEYGSLYVVGGATTANAPATATYRSPVQVQGDVSWKTQNALPAGRSRFGFGAWGLYLYVVGGESAAIAPNDTGAAGSPVSTVYVAKLNPSTRDIATAWTTTTALPGPRSAHSAVFGFGNVLVSGGLYAGASAHTSENIYAPINVDGTLGTFASAGGASLFSVCGCNLFNHGATWYFGGDGNFHALIAGGDNVNANGARRAETFKY